MTQLADLLSPQTQSQLYAQGLAVYQANGFSVQSWQPGGTERSRLMAFTSALGDVVSNYIPSAAGGGFLDYASQAWMQLTAAELYNIVYYSPTATLGNVTATTVSGAGPYSANAGDLIVVFGASGRRYINTSAVTIPANGSVSFPVRAETTGAAYNDPSNSGALTLVTPLPGVSLTNPAGTYSGVIPVGAGTGSLALSGTPTAPHQVTVRADTTGSAATTSWSYSLDGAPFVSFGVGIATNLAGTGINVTLIDTGAGGTSFVAGMTLSFSTPGSWITSQGTDVESVTALANRCRNRWASLSPIPTNSLYQLLATSTPVYGPQVTQVVVVPDQVVNNQVNIIVAGPAGSLPSAVVAGIQAYINPRVPLTDKPLVSSPSTLNITIGGTATVLASQLAAAQNAILVALTNYIASVGINGTLRVSAIIDAIMNVAGVVDVTGVTINGNATNLTLGSSSTYVLPSLVTPLTLGYVTQ